MDADQIPALSWDEIIVALRQTRQEARELRIRLDRALAMISELEKKLRKES